LGFCSFCAFSRETIFICVGVVLVVVKEVWKRGIYGNVFGLWVVGLDEYMIVIIDI
jgi:hypothetical protein